MRRDGQRPWVATLVDVAREAKVSRATAARALGGYGSVSSATRRRVTAAAERLNYRPNDLARSIKSGASGTLGIVISDIQLAFAAGVVRGISDAARPEGMEVFVTNTDEDVVNERAAVSALINKRVDGLIVVPAEPGDTVHLRDAQQRGIPVVLIDRVAADLTCDSVVIDNVLAAQVAVDHLLALGHRRIGIVVEAPIPDWTTLGALRLDGRPAALRAEGWAAALRSAGVPVTKDLIIGVRYDRRDAHERTLDALRRPDRPTALLAVDEAMTLGAIDAIHGAGLSNPKDISLIGFDDSPWATAMEPQISVVAQPTHDLGWTAAKHLLRRMAGYDGPTEATVLPTAFVQRASTAALAAGERPAGIAGAADG